MELTAGNIAAALDHCTIPNDGHKAMRERFPDYAIFLTMSGDFVAQNLRGSNEPTRRFRLVEVTE